MYCLYQPLSRNPVMRWRMFGDYMTDEGIHPHAVWPLLRSHDLYVLLGIVFYTSPLITLWTVIPYLLFARIIYANMVAGILFAVFAFGCLLVSMVLFHLTTLVEKGVIPLEEQNDLEVPSTEWSGVRAFWETLKLAIAWPIIAVFRGTKSVLLNGWFFYYRLILSK